MSETQKLPDKELVRRNDADARSEIMGRLIHWQRLWAIESEKASRATSQIREALAILESGTEYERSHLRGILEAGL